MWSALSDERMGLSFTIADGPRTAQSFSGQSPVGLTTIFYCLRFKTSLFVAPTTRRATVEVFDPAFAQEVRNPPWVSEIKYVDGREDMQPPHYAFFTCTSYKEKLKISFKFTA
jgi:hypothetical protein